MTRVREKEVLRPLLVENHRSTLASPELFQDYFGAQELGKMTQVNGL
jgi:hypothetical protein